MKERLAEIFGVHAIKYFVPIAISFIGGLFLLLRFPSLIERLPFGKKISGFVLLVAFSLAIFLLILFLQWLWKKHKTRRALNEQEEIDHARQMTEMRDLIEDIANNNRGAYSIVLWLVKNQNKLLRTHVRYHYYERSSIIYETQNLDGTFMYKLTDEAYYYLNACYQENGLLGHLPRDIPPAKTAEETEVILERGEGSRIRVKKNK